MNGISILALTGRAARQKTAPGNATTEVEEAVWMEGVPALVNQIGEDFYVYGYDGRYDVIGSAERAREFKGSGHLPYTRTPIGSAPQARGLSSRSTRRSRKTSSA